jgi:hypothetical protein
MAKIMAMPPLRVILVLGGSANFWAGAELFRTYCRLGAC